MKRFHILTIILTLSLLASMITTAQAATDYTTRVSVASDGMQGNFNSG